MGAAIGIGVVEIAEAIGGIIGGAAAESAATAAAAGVEAAAEAASEAAIAEALAGGATESAAEAAGEAAAEAAISSSAGSAIASVEDAKIAELLENIRVISPSLAEDVGAFNAEINEMLDAGLISEQGAYESTLLEDITSSELEGLEMSASEFEAFNVEASEEFGELSSEAKGKFDQLKKLGKKVVDRIKQGLLSCKKSGVRLTECVVGLVETIDFLHEHFFKKGKLPGNVIPSFQGFDSYQIGSLVAELTSRGINEYFDQLVKNPAIVKSEEVIDHLILNSFKKISNELHNSLARKLYGIIRSSKFIKSKEVQNKFDQVYKTYNGKFTSFPFRDQSGLITYIDEVGNRISYKDATNAKSVTTFYGTWCGPLSYNDTYPLWDERSPEEGKTIRRAGSGLLDSFCMAHDCDYSFKSTGGGWFNQVGDFKLISRILQTQQHMTFQERSYAMMTVAWFSTLGTILNSYLHPLIVNFDPQDPIRSVTSDAAKDIYSLLFPTRSQTTPNGRILLAGNDDQQNIDQRKEFYRGMKDKLDERQVDFVSKNGSTIGDRVNLSALLLHFDSIMVQPR